MKKLRNFKKEFLIQLSKAKLECDAAWKKIKKISTPYIVSTKAWYKKQNKFLLLLSGLFITAIVLTFVGIRGVYTDVSSKVVDISSENEEESTIFNDVIFILKNPRFWAVLIVIIGALLLMRWVWRKKATPVVVTSPEKTDEEKKADKKKEALKPITPKSFSWRIKNFASIVFICALALGGIFWANSMGINLKRDFSYHGPDPYAQRPKVEAAPGITYSNNLPLQKGVPFTVYWKNSAGSFAPVLYGTITIRFIKEHDPTDNFDLRITRTPYELRTEWAISEGDHENGNYTATLLSESTTVEYREQQTVPLLHFAQ